MKKTLLVFSCLYLLLAVNRSFGDVPIALAAGTSFIGDPVNNPPNTLDVLLPNAPDGSILYTWNCASQSYDQPQQFIAGSGWFDINFNPSTTVLTPGQGVVFDNPGGPTTLTFVGTTFGLPVLPPAAYCGCGVYSLLGLQTTNLTGTFQNVTGMAPIDGAELLAFNGASFVEYDFTTAGGWSPSTPIVGIGQGVFIVQPCSTNPCLVVTCPTNKSVPCSSTNWSFDLPIVMDTCCSSNSSNYSGYAITVVGTVTTNAGPCNQISTRTWLITDCTSNTVTCTQSVTLLGSPSVICPTNKTVTCASNIVFDPPGVISACCGSNFVISVLSTVTTNTGPCTSVITRTWQIIDCCGNTNICSQMVTVVPGPLMAPCTPVLGANLVPNPGFENYTSCPNSFSQLSLAAPWFQPTQGTPDFFNVCASPSVVGVPANAFANLNPHSGQGYAGGNEFTWNGTGAPDSGREYLETPLTTTLTAGHTYQVSFYVCRSPGFRFAVDDLGAYFSQGQITDGTTSGTLTTGSGFYTPQVRNPAGQFLSSTTAWMLIQGSFVASGVEDHVTLGNFADDPNTPYLTFAANASYGAYYFYDDVAVQELTLNCTSNKTVPCSSNWVFDTPVFTNACCGTNITVSILSTVTTNTGPCTEISTRTWLATDCCGNTNTWSETVTVTSAPPVVVRPTDKTIPCTSNVVFDLPIVVTSCCGTNYNISILSTVTTNNSGGCGEMSTRTWSITDCCGNSNTCSQTVTVTGSVMVVTCPTNKTVPCTSNVVFDLPAVSTPCCGSNYTISILSTVTTNTGGCGEMSTRTWSITDCCGNSNTCSQTVTVTGSVLVVTCPTNKTVPCTSNVVFNPPTVSSTCCGTNYTISILSTVTTNTGGCGEISTRTWSITDCCGNSNTCSQTVTVTGSAMVITCPTNKTVPCTSNVVFNPPTVSSPCCGTNYTISILSTVTTNTGGCGEISTRTWSITDCCGNSNTCSQTVTVTGSAMVITCPTNKTVPCTSNVVFNPPTVSSPCCGTNYTISILSTVTTNTGGCGETSTRTWSITDCCGNSNTCSQTVTVTGSAMVVTCPTNKTISCNSNVVFDLPVVSSPCCGTNYTISIISTTTNNLGPCTQLKTRTWSITDCCGHSNTCSQTVTVTHPPPVFVGIASKTVPCGTNWNWNTPVATDACCGTNVSVGILSTTSTGTHPQILTRKWVATNCCGLTNTFTEVVTLLNNPPPNDECTNAIRVYANTTICGTTLCATPSLAGTLFPAPCGNSLASPDVWYLYTSECGGTVTVDTCGACPGMGNFNTVLSVYTGECGQLMQVACNDDAPLPHPCGVQSRVTFTAQGCSTYYIRVAGHNGVSGNFQLNIGETVTTPANDLCANATPVGNGTYPFQNCGANTDGPNTPTNCPTYNDVWFRYTAPCTGVIWAETCDSCFCTVLSAYSGSCGNLHLITCNEHATAGRCAGSLSSFISFNVTAGTTYYLRVGSCVSGVTGSGFLTVSGPFPAPQHCPSGGAAYCRYFDVVGAANNTPWSWSIEVSCCMSLQVTNVPGVPVGGNAAALAAAFVASINGVGCSGVVATTAGLPPGWFRVCVNSCSNPATPFIFRVGAAGTPAQSQCVVVGSTLPTSGPCSFNPDIFELTTSGQDLNTNGMDDAIDILDGTSLDLDQNGVPDEVQNCVPPILTDYPDSQSIPLGANISLSAAASGTPAPVYQWSFGGVPLSDGGNISGSASNVLSIQSVTLTNLGDYTVTVSNFCGGATSTPATLSAAVMSIPVIAGSGFQPDGSFQFNFQTQAGINYVIEYTEGLTSPVWIPLETVQGDGDVRQMADLWPLSAARFYRVRTLGP